VTTNTGTYIYDSGQVWRKMKCMRLGKYFSYFIRFAL